MSESKNQKTYTCDGCGKTQCIEDKISPAEPKGWAYCYATEIENAHWCTDCIELLVEAGWIVRKEPPHWEQPDRVVGQTEATKTPPTLPSAPLTPPSNPTPAPSWT